MSVFRGGHFSKNNNCTVYIPDSAFLVGRFKEFCSPKCRLAAHRAQKKGTSMVTPRLESFNEQA